MNATEFAEQNEIFRTLNGSRLYGTNVESSDEDYASLFVESVDSVYGDRKLETVQLRDKPEGVRSEAGDVDCTSYSLRHFAKLAAEGNPSVLAVLFAPDSAVTVETYISKELRRPLTRQRFASKKAGGRFSGYLKNQKERMLGLRSGHVPNRPELVEKFGYDTKYANHAVRLGIQGVEYMNTGELTLPMDRGDVELLLAVRYGEFTFDGVIELIESIQEDLEDARTTTSLPDEPDYEGISMFLRAAHEDWWDLNRSLRS